jgi:branched-chain amino acid aminotransferase
MQWVCHNGLLVPAETPLFTAANRGFRYGDGVFETATFCNGRMQLAGYHFDRLLSGLKLLNSRPDFTATQLSEHIAELCHKNACTTLARVRIAAYRNEMNTASFVLEAVALNREKQQWNETGWRLVMHPFVRKSCDAYSNLKSANYLPYVMAGQYAHEHGVEECLVLNLYNRICDGSKTNLFFMKDDAVYTPALSEGCVAGVMRRAVIEFLKASGYTVHQKGITEADVLQADHVFVTNAIEGLRWVQQFGDRTYEHGGLKKLYHDFTATLQSS